MASWPFERLKLIYKYAVYKDSVYMFHSKYKNLQTHTIHSIPQVGM